MTVWKMHMWNQPRLSTKVSKLLSKVLFEGLRCLSVVEHLPVVPTVSEALGSILNTAGKVCWRNDSDPCFFVVKSLECNVSLFSWWPWRQQQEHKCFSNLQSENKACISWTQVDKWQLYLNWGNRGQVLPTCALCRKPELHLPSLNLIFMCRVKNIFCFVLLCFFLLYQYLIKQGIEISNPKILKYSWHVNTEKVKYAQDWDHSESMPSMCRIVVSIPAPEGTKSSGFLEHSRLDTFTQCHLYKYSRI